MGCRWSVCGYDIGCGYQMCEYCDKAIPFWEGFYQIQDGVSVGQCFQTVLCQKCYHNKEIELAGGSIPDYYATIQQRYTGQPQVDFGFRRKMTWRWGDRYYYTLYQKILCLVAKHHESIQIISNKTNLCQAIARLHWKRATNQLHEKPATAFEIEMFRILDNTPYLYQKSNFIVLEQEVEPSTQIKNKVHKTIIDSPPLPARASDIEITRMSV